ncbi:unnamed protein product [Rotaria sp. Silwood2]|nr:unnamed protein product [Rotaria sp. Silwood2]
MDGTIHTASVNGLSSTVVPITNHKKNSNETITYDDRIDTGNETDNADSQSTNRKIFGSHGQELLPSGLHVLKQTASVVELVMLLCSQEWQNSLQKHAGLAFIELVTEGRLLSHASKDHVVKVANEADFILNRMRADDIRKASEFEQLSAQTTVEHKSEEQLCEHFITTAPQRHQVIASYDLRQWRRLIRNPNGSIRSEALQKSSFHGINDDIITSVIQEENLLKQLKQQKIQNFNQTIPDDDEILQVDEKDLDQDFSGPIRFSTECSLICGTTVTHDTLAMTHNAMLFDANECDESFTKIDSKQVLFAFNDRSIVKKVVSFLPRVGVGSRYGLPQQRRTSLASPKQLFRSANMIQRWQRREISNFEYLIYLNTIAGIIE